EVDVDLSAHDRGAEGHLERDLDVLSTLGLPRLAIPTAEHRAEDVAEPAESAEVHLLEAKTAPTSAVRSASTVGARATARSSGAGAAESAECAKAAHLVVLFALLGVTEHLICLRDLLEALGGLRVVLILVRVVFR